MAGARLRQRFVQRAEQEVVHQPLLAETDLMLGRMHVHIHAGRVQFQVQHERRMAPVEQHVGISLAHRMRNDAIAHQPPVDVEILRVRLRTRRGRQAYPARQMQAGRGMIDAQALGWEILAHHFRHAQQRRAFIARRLEDAHRLAVVAQAEFHRTARQRQRFQQIVDMRELGALRTEKLASRRHVVEQVAHFHAAALRVLRRARRLHLAAVHLDAECGVHALRARGQRKARHR